VINTHGKAVAEDSVLCRALLNDYCHGELQREIFLLVSAVDERVATELLNAGKDVPFQLIRMRLIQRLCELRGIEESLSIWAVETWALALCCITKDQLSSLLVKNDSIGTIASPPVLKSLGKIVSSKGDGDFRTITDAIRDASSGDTISLRPGIYIEDFTIDKPITIRCDGIPGEAVVEGHDGSCIVIETSGDVKLHGLTIHCNTKFKRESDFQGMKPMEIASKLTPDECFTSAVLVTQGNVTVENCTLTSNNFSGFVILGKDTRALLNGCSIIHCGINGAFISESNAIFTDCKIGKNKCVGLMAGNANVEMVSCKIFEHDNEENAQGISLFGGSECVIEESDIYSCGKGLMTTESCKLVLTNCKVYGCSEVGILFPTNANGRIRDCEIYQCGIGVGVGENSECVIDASEIYGCGKGLMTTESSKLVLTNSKVYQCSDFGIFFPTNSNGRIRDCEIYQCGIGVGLGENSEAFITTTHIHKCQAFGVACKDASKVTITDCKIKNNDGCGVAIKNKSSGSITGCDMTFNAGGAFDIGFFESLFNVHRSNNQE